MLNIGEKIFIPSYGAGIVLEIEIRNFLGDDKEYIIIYLIVDDMDLMIPLDKIDNYKIRLISSETQIEKELCDIGQIPLEIEVNWNKRYRMNRNKIASGKLTEMFQVLRELYYLQIKEELPTGEEKILEKAKHLLASEIMLIFGISVNEAYEKLKNIYCTNIF